MKHSIDPSKHAIGISVLDETYGVSWIIEEKYKTLLTQNMSMILRECKDQRHSLLAGVAYTWHVKQKDTSHLLEELDMLPGIVTTQEKKVKRYIRSMSNKKHSCSILVPGLDPARLEGRKRAIQTPTFSFPQACTDVFQIQKIATAHKEWSFWCDSDT